MKDKEILELMRLVSKATKANTKAIKFNREMIRELTKSLRNVVKIMG